MQSQVFLLLTFIASSYAIWVLAEFYEDSACTQPLYREHVPVGLCYSFYRGRETSSTFQCSSDLVLDESCDGKCAQNYYPTGKCVARKGMKIIVVLFL